MYCRTKKMPKIAVIGYISDKKERECAIRILKKIPNVVLLSELNKPLPHDVFLNYIRHARFLLYTDTYFGGGLTVLESLSIGTPVIAFKNPILYVSNPNAPIIFIEYDTSLEIPEDSAIKTYAKEFLRLLYDTPDKYEQLVKRARAYGIQFSWRKVAIAELRTYLKILRKLVHK